MADSVSDVQTSNRRGGLGSDLAVLPVLAVVSGAVQTSLLSVPDPIRTVSGLFLVLVLPGYALIAALFPRSRAILARSADSPSGFFGRFAVGESNNAPTLVRATLSLAASVAVSSLVGIVLGTTVGFTTSQFAIGLTSVIIVCTAVGLVRRASLQPAERYAPAVASGLVDATRSIGRGGPFSGVVRLVVIASLLVSMGSAAYAVSVPQQGETPTELYLLTENSTGELTASGYPTTLPIRQQQTLQFGVRNYERTRTQFTVVVTIDRVISTDNSSVVIQQSEVDRFSKTLVPGQWWRKQYEVDPQLTGSNLRLTHYLYRGEAPEKPDADGAYRLAYVQLSNGENGPVVDDNDPVVESVGPTTEDERPSDTDSTSSSTDDTDPITESDRSDGESDQFAGNETESRNGSDTDLGNNSETAPDDELELAPGGNTSADDEPIESDGETTRPVNESE